MAFVDKYKESVRKNKPIVYNGLEFKPLTVEHLGVYQAAKPSFELMQSSLPPKLAVLSWCNCLDAMDKQAAEAGMTTYFLPLALMVVAFSLGLQPMGKDGNYPLRDARDANGNIVAFVVGISNPVILNPMDMDEIRKIIAAQNLYEIPDESWNPDLVRARKHQESLGKSDIDYNVDDLIYSVALNAHVKPEEIWDWTIRDFIMTQNAIDRTLNYQIFMTAEHSGFVKFNKGNPYPSWKFNRNPEMPNGFVTVAEMDAGAKGLLGVTTKEIE